MSMPADLLFLFVLSASISGWGAISLQASSDWSRRFGAGTLVLFCLIAAAGWSGLLLPAVLWVILGAGLLLWARPGRFSNPGTGGALALMGLILLPLVALPPSSRDAMIHHLYQARIWIDSGRIIRPGFVGYFSYPYLTESLYSLTGGTFGFRISRSVSFLGFLASCTVITSHYLRRGKKREALLSMLIMLSIPELLRNATWSYSDSFLVFFSLLAYIEMVRKDGNPLLAVLWAGGASACKYNGFIVLVSVALLLPFYFRKVSVRTYLAAYSGALFLIAWWAVPNLLQWGNPVYPLMRGIFGPETTGSLRGAGYDAAGAFGTSLHGVTDYLLLPLRMSLHGQWDDPVLFDGASGPLLLAGTIISIPVLRERRRKFLLPVIFLLLTLVSKGSGIRTRYLLPGLAMLSVPITDALGTLLSSRGSIIRYTTIGLIGGCLVWSASRLADLYATERPWEYFDDSQYLSERVHHYTFFTRCGEHLTSEDTTLFVNMIRPFYYPGYAVFDEKRVPQGLLEMFWSGMDSGRIADSLRSQGITKLAMDMFLTSVNVPTELDSLELMNWKEFVSLRLSPVLTVGNDVLFELR